MHYQNSEDCPLLNEKCNSLHVVEIIGTNVESNIRCIFCYWNNTEMQRFGGKKKYDRGKYSG